MLSARTLTELLKSRAEYKAQLLNYITVLDASDEPEVKENMEEAVRSCLDLIQTLDSNISKIQDMNSAEGYLA